MLVEWDTYDKPLTRRFAGRDLLTQLLQSGSRRQIYDLDELDCDLSDVGSTGSLVGGWDYVRLKAHEVLVAVGQEWTGGMHGLVSIVQGQEQLEIVIGVHRYYGR